MPIPKLDNKYRFPPALHICNKLDFISYLNMKNVDYGNVASNSGI